MAPMSKLTYCKPQEAGLASEARAVGRRIAALLDTLDEFTWALMEDGGPDSNTLPNDCRLFRRTMIEKLEAEGWRLKVKSNDKWSVLPPKDY